eukprot:TRINITY_DN7918_c0_g1_i5.p1 TRINITY_DN7918_c0_g1~~TRINITY_DN7918_c0_g1_i5.p1  ORF type:complete len:124 (+),score=17.75 TRINITY_DN7918_c0_g1_i5:356-727(+)
MGGQDLVSDVPEVPSQDHFIYRHVAASAGRRSYVHRDAHALVRLTDERAVGAVKDRCLKLLEVQCSVSTWVVWMIGGFAGTLGREAAFMCGEVYTGIFGNCHRTLHSLCESLASCMSGADCQS